MKYKKHIFICTNERPADAKKSCGEACGLKLVSTFRKLIKEAELKNIRVQKAGCLDVCDYGPSLVVYPEGIFYGGVSEGDVSEIVTEHLINERPVTKHIINFPD